MVRIPYRCSGTDAAGILGAPFPDLNYAYSVSRWGGEESRYCHVSGDRSLYESVNPSEEEVIFQIRRSEWESPPFYFVPGSLVDLILLVGDLERVGEVVYSRGEETWFLRLISANYYQEVAVYSPERGFRTLWGDFRGFEKAWEVLAFFEPPCPPAVSASLAKKMGDADGLQSFYSLNLDQQVVCWLRESGCSEYLPRVVGEVTGLRSLP